LRLLGNEEDRRSLHSEVEHHAGRQLTPNHAGVWNPAFDVTPAKYVTAIITGRGVLRGPYPESLDRLSHEAAQA
jgi:methylthioribose-1-phosphate isomerase